MTPTHTKHHCMYKHKDGMTPVLHTSAKALNPDKRENYTPSGEVDSCSYIYATTLFPLGQASNACRKTVSTHSQHTDHSASQVWVHSMRRGTLKVYQVAANCLVVIFSPSANRKTWWNFTGCLSPDALVKCRGPMRQIEEMAPYTQAT